MADSPLVGKISKKIEEGSARYYDVNYDLKGRRGVNPLYNNSIVVAYIMWLNSMPGDFIRNPTHGGFFRAQLNRYRFDPSSETQIEEDLRKESNSIFPDLQILDISVKCVYERRTWQVKVSVMDKNTAFVADTAIEYPALS